MAENRDAVYCTLLTSDNYLPGAMVLAHSLRDNGTEAKIVVLVTPDTLQSSTIEELQSIYDEVIPVDRMINVSPANLYLMDRPDLISTFTKIELWKQIQYRQIVYIDADVIALRAPDELLTLDTNFAAVPDIGWPDCFNSGVMVLRPNLQDYYSLLAFAQRGISFDGADQGLLNMHFTNWKRLSFAYNCTPSGHYQYIPAFRHFQSTISMVHYIGQRKPWNLSRQMQPIESPYNQMLARWWAVYDRHYRPVILTAQFSPAKTGYSESYPPTQPFSETISVPQVSQGTLPSNPVPERWATANISGLATASEANDPPAVASFPSLETGDPTRLFGGSQPEVMTTQYVSATENTPENTYTNEPGNVPAVHSLQALPTHHAVPSSNPSSFDEGSLRVDEPERAENVAPIMTIAAASGQDTRSHQVPVIKPPVSVVPQYVCGEEHVSVPRPSSMNQASIQQHSIPTPGKSNVFTNRIVLPPRPFIPVTQHPVAAKADAFEPSSSQNKESTSAVLIKDTQPAAAPMSSWDAARAPPPADSKPEAANFPTQIYKMSESTQLFRPPKSYPDAPKDMYYKVPAKAPAAVAAAPVFPWEKQAPLPSRVFFDETDTTAEVTSLGQMTSEAPETQLAVNNLMARGPLRSTWDSYERTNAWDEVPAIGKYMQSIQKSRKGSVQVLSETVSTGRRPSMKVTDFPTEVERPSLPVTPAPIRRRSYLEEDEDEEVMQGAEGVPKQEEWNPVDQLERLHQHHCEFLDRALQSDSQEKRQ